MRIGVNPEKNKEEFNVLKKHRIIIVFYIPNLIDDYYKQALDVLDYQLDSILKTISLETTAITLINNKSSDEVSRVYNKYSNLIDKYVVYNENKGKVYAVLNEVRSVFEPFVTITDSDVLFFDGWEKEVFSIFKNFPKAGVVTPLPIPYNAFYFNENLFFNNLWSRIVKYDKIVKDEDIDKYVKGINNPAAIMRNSKHNWKEKQYFLCKNNKKAIIGASHFVATYKTALFRNIYTFPEVKFKNGYEEQFIDILSFKKGLYRLSTQETFAYHMGNTVDEEVHGVKITNEKKITPIDFMDINYDVPKNKFVMYKVYILKAIRKTKKIINYKF